LKGPNCKAKGTNNNISSQAQGGRTFFNLIQTLGNNNNQDVDDDLEVIGNSINHGDHIVTKKRERTKEIKFVEGPTESELIHDIVLPDEETEGQCVVCLSKKAVCIVHPCRHACCCVECSRTLCLGTKGDELKERGKVKCPLCKKDAKSILRVF
jgi:hypothetical protein